MDQIKVENVNMDNAKVLLFFSPRCGHCGRALEDMEKIKRTDIIYEKIDVTSPEGNELAQNFEIEAVPTYIISGPGFEDNIGLRGYQDSRTLNRYIDVALGKIKLDDWKKGILDRIIDLLQKRWNSKK